MAERVKRSRLAHFLNTTPGGASETWSQIGKGHTGLSTSYNASTETVQYINEDSGTTTVDSYAPAISATQIAHTGDPVFDFVDDLSFNLAIGSDAETDYLEVRLYKPEGANYKARKFRASISIDSEGDEATSPLERSYNINFMGDPIIGTFNPATKAFTPDTTGGDL